MAPKKIIVISDLHVGAGATDDCDSELEGHLTGFLGSLCSSSESIELVINGDFLDFVQAAPWKGKELRGLSPDNVPLCFTEEQSLTKFAAIAKAHEAVFKALYGLVAINPENRIVILPGNHDADFFWPKVQGAFKDQVCEQDDSAKERIIFYLDQVYRPAAYDRVWIEHGHQYDPLNAFYVGEKSYWSANNPPILQDTNGERRLIECTGTRFMSKFMNGLDLNYPFVDNVKPFSRFLTIFGASALVWGFGPIKAAVSVWAMLRYLVSTVTHNSDDLLGLDQTKAQEAPLLLEMAKEMLPDEVQSFSLSLRDRGFDLPQALPLYLQSKENADKLMMFLSEHLDLLEGVQSENPSFLGAEAGTLQLKKGFSVDETKELIRAATKTLSTNVLDCVIMGHTHERVENPPGVRYLNTGTWTRYYQFADDERLKPWSLLKSRSYEVFPYQLNYAEVVPGRLEPVKLITYFERTS